jgi:hypothetical protein
MVENDEDGEPRDPYTMGGEDWRRLGLVLRVLMIVGVSAFATVSIYIRIALCALILGFYFFCHHDVTHLCETVFAVNAIAI